MVFLLKKLKVNPFVIPSTPCQW